MTQKLGWSALMLAGVLVAAWPATAATNQIRDALRNCRPMTEDKQLLIGSCLKAIDSGMLEHDALAEAWINVAGGHIALKEYPAAESAAAHAIDADPNKWQGYANRGLAEAMEQKNDLAETDLNKAVEMAPKEPGAVGTRGRAYLAEGRLDQAVADLTAAIALDDTSAWAYSLRADAYTRQGKTDLAATDRAKVHALNPDDTPGLQKPKM
ncbi:MAG TPA: tetratricopeptide repeat protein [Rhizomicrobium sp.]|jgi:tetratricopeptide (TPR) repeat protein